jgi:hypothetical protein
VFYVYFIGSNYLGSFRRCSLYSSVRRHILTGDSKADTEDHVTGSLSAVTYINRGADKSLARPASRCILFNGENISFDASLVLYIYI